MEAFPANAGEEYVPSLEDDPALGLSHRAKMEILFAVMLGLFLGALDQTIVGPALPTIVTQLSGNDVYVWAVMFVTLTFGLNWGVQLPPYESSGEQTMVVDDSKTYGTIGVVFTFLTWFILIATVIVVGAALGAVWLNRRGVGSVPRGA